MGDKKCTAEQLKQMFLDDGYTNTTIEYVYKPMSKEELEKVTQYEPRPNPWLKSQYATKLGKFPKTNRRLKL